MATRSLAALVAVLAVIPASAIAAPPAPSSASCTVSAQGPFLYVDIVIPVASVQCDTQQRRLHIETELTRDGVAVASAPPSARTAPVGGQGVDAGAPAVAGTQLGSL